MHIKHIRYFNREFKFYDEKILKTKVSTNSTYLIINKDLEILSFQYKAIINLDTIEMNIKEDPNFRDLNFVV